MNSINCCDRATRRQLTAQEGPLNGIDFIDVDYHQHRLHVYLYESATVDPESITVVDARRNKRLPTNLINGTATNVLILGYTKTDEAPQEGRTYRLKLRRVDNGLATNDPPVGFDPRFSEIEFIYNETVSSEVDFQQPASLVSSIFPKAEIDYLAKDYGSFRRLILDRLATTMPQWQESHAADLGMTLVELLAYIGDHLSYHQDAVATEGYLDTARRRESVRRHARLVDYRMHEGCNSRALLFVDVISDLAFAPEDVFFITQIPEAYQIKGIVHSESDLPTELYQDVVCFEPLMPPGGSWRLTIEDIKDVSAFLSNGPALKKYAKYDTAGYQQLQDKRQASDSEISKLVRTVNRFLENGVLSDQEVDKRILLSIRHLPMRYRNRALFDAIFSEYVSSAQIDGLVRLYQTHNEIDFYTWDEQECWIPKGATSATLTDCSEPPAQHCGKTTTSASWSQRSQLSRLSAGDFLLFEERIGPRTGREADANPNHRQFVRLTKVRFSYDPAYGKDKDKDDRWKVPLVEIEWDEKDKLQFPLCVSSRKQPASGCEIAERVSVARGNIVPVDQGRTLAPQEIGTAHSKLQQTDCGNDWDDAEIIEVHETLRPFIQDANINYAEPIDRRVSASKFQASDPRKATAQISLIGIPGVDGNNTVRLRPADLNAGDLAGFTRRFRSLDRFEQRVLEDQLGAKDASDLSRLARENLQDDTLRPIVTSLREALTWLPRWDLLSSGNKDQHFVVENDQQHNVHLRFGDGLLGRQPVGGTKFYATLRSGNGVRGNVGAGSISDIVFRRNFQGVIGEIRNPLAAFGAVAPESLREVKLHAPHKWLIKQARAVLAEDYANLVLDKFASQIQNAKAAINWVGSYWLVEVAIDPFAEITDVTGLVNEVSKYLDAHRRIGHRVKVDEGAQVPIALGMTVCVRAGYAPEDVRAALIERFSNRRLKDGSLGFFHPDRLTFGMSIYSSHIVQEAVKISGVADVTIDFLHRCESGPCHSVKDSSASCGSSNAAQGTGRTFDVGTRHRAKVDELNEQSVIFSLEDGQKAVMPFRDFKERPAKGLEIEVIILSPVRADGMYVVTFAIRNWTDYVVPIDELEIAQLDNDRTLAKGFLCLNMGGGR